MCVSHIRNGKIVVFILIKPKRGFVASLSESGSQFLCYMLLMQHYRSSPLLFQTSDCNGILEGLQQLLSDIPDTFSPLRKVLWEESCHLKGR